MEEKLPKRLPKESIKLQFAGSLILAQCPDPKYLGLFRRFSALLESFANMDATERTLNYKFLNALMFTAHAKKTDDPKKRKELFDKKNEIILDILKNKEQNRKIAYKYLKSSNFLVTDYCEKCSAENAKNEKQRHSWKFCKNCKVDRSFYNIISIFHKFKEGSACIFLSNEFLDQVPVKHFKNKGKLADHKEEILFDKYHYTVKNLDAFKLDSVYKMFEKIIGK